jgi:hypothetical protein
MALLPETFDTEALPVSTISYDPIPEGTYSAILSQAELRDNATQTGQYIKLRFDILGPTHAGRIVFANINIRNASPKATEIGLAQFGELLRAIGLPSCRDTDQLVGANILIKVGIRAERTDDKTGKTYPANNEVRGYRSKEGSPPPAAKPANNGTVIPPWKK